MYVNRAQVAQLTPRSAGQTARRLSPAAAQVPLDQVGPLIGRFLVDAWHTHVLVPGLL